MKPRIAQLEEEARLADQKIREVAGEIRRLQESCIHQFVLHSHFRREFGDDDDKAQWWVHLTCSLCDFRESTLQPVPVCRQCLRPLIHLDDSDERVAEALLTARKQDPFATKAFAFLCPSCTLVYGFASRGDTKK